MMWLYLFTDEDGLTPVVWIKTLFLILILFLISPHPLDSGLDLQLLWPSKVAGMEEKVFQAWRLTVGAVIKQAQSTLQRRTPAFCC